MSIDNFDLITPLLKFDSEDDFYFLQIMQRKKENPNLGSNSRIIKNYYIRSVDYLLERKEEIIKLCDVFNARACIRLNRRSHRKVAFKTLQKIADQMANQDFQHVGKAYASACGSTHNEQNKTWIIDIDDVDSSGELRSNIVEVIDLLQPEGKKLVATIPSKSGWHLITKPFNVAEAKRLFNGTYELHKDNPSNIYIP